LETRGIPAAQWRAPVWPKGFVGSISHTDGCHAAAVARRGELIALGIDVEAERELRDGVVNRIVSRREQARLAEHQDDWQVMVPVVFSAKESLFKMYHPRVRSWLDFLDAEVDIDPGAGTLWARITADHRPGIDGRREFSGRFSRHAGLAFTAVWMSA
jgi:4'-phosphopantetheinyl transferase EntD